MGCPKGREGAVSVGFGGYPACAADSTQELLVLIGSKRRKTCKMSGENSE